MVCMTSSETCHNVPGASAALLPALDASVDLCWACYPRVRQCADAATLVGESHTSGGAKPNANAAPKTAVPSVAHLFRYNSPAECLFRWFDALAVDLRARALTFVEFGPAPTLSSTSISISMNNQARPFESSTQPMWQSPAAPSSDSTHATPTPPGRRKRPTPSSSQSASQSASRVVTRKEAKRADQRSMLPDYVISDDVACDGCRMVCRNISHHVGPTHRIDCFTYAVILTRVLMSCSAHVLHFTEARAVWIPHCLLYC